VLKDFEYYDHARMRSCNYNNFRLYIVVSFNVDTFTILDKNTVIEFCDSYVKDMEKYPSECMSDYYLFDEQNNQLITVYKSKSQTFSVTEVFPEDYPSIKIDDQCMINLDHQIIQFQDGKSFYWNMIDSDGFFELKNACNGISGIVLENVWFHSQKVWIKL